MSKGDRAVRAMTDDGAFRIVAVRTTDTLREILKIKDAHGDDARIVGDLLTCAVLHRATMSPAQRVQCILRGADDSGQLATESDPEGFTRALLRKAPGGLKLKGKGGVLSMQRGLYDGRVHTGSVDIPEDGLVASAMMSYFDLSEQIPTMIALGTVMDGDEVVASGGFLVQILAEAKDAKQSLAVMALRLEEFVDIHDRLRDNDASPDYFIDEVLYLMPHTALGEESIRSGCNCSEARLFTSLATLDHADLESLVASSEPLESTCDWCGTTYVIAPARLRGLLTSS